MTCQKLFEINVGAPFCGLFAGLAWGVPTIEPTASGTFVGPLATLTASLFVPAAFAASVQNTGTVLYTGPEVICNCRFVISDLTDFSSTSILITHPLFPVFPGILTAGFETPTDVPGTYDFPFTVPASVGDLLTVTLAAIAGGGDFSGATGSCDLSIQL